MEKNADEEGIETKLIPKHYDASARGSSSGALGAFVPAILVLGLAVVAYFFLNK